MIATLSALALAVLLAMCSTLDGPDDHRSEWDQSEALKELQAGEAITARREASAQALCNQERGPNSEARWTPAGRLVCTTRRGASAITCNQSPRDGDTGTIKNSC